MRRPRPAPPTARRAPRAALSVALLLAAALAAAACTKADALRIARIAATRDAAGASSFAAQKAANYAANPAALELDLKAFAAVLDSFRKAVRGEWGKDEERVPEAKKYVKYTQAYKSRAQVDFDAGTVTVETLDEAKPKESLVSAVTTTLLAPYDPRAVDLYSASAVTVGETPFLYGEVRDHEDKTIRWEWRAKRFAEHLVATDLRTRTIDTPQGKRTVRAVSFPMVRDHLGVRAAKYKSLVDDAAKRFGVSRNLIFAIMKTESDFNPYAVSSAPAFGLMQVVPSTAGGDVYRFLNDKSGEPSPAFLLKPSNNVVYGSAYLHLLDAKYLAAISDPVSREYCVIAGYNGGPGSVQRVFGGADAVNGHSPAQVFDTLRTKHPYAETRRYLEKVVAAKRLFVNL
ncbi:MAG: DUF3393 domain-containing protein [Desulfovibrionaceae bacterium]|jgi:membrane-bound lytic murein transglycosylase C|nr:DUF3393 domain-containing protein [Desulfovibrionaceae bacterium]